MAVKIRCSECRKKISVDEAFAGSMCRCPYCKSIVMVPKIAAPPASSPGGRPSAPAKAAGRIVRPRTPQTRNEATGGSGLENVVGSRPIIDISRTQPRRRRRGVTPISQPGRPQIPGDYGQAAQAARQAAAEATQSAQVAESKAATEAQAREKAQAQAEAARLEAQRRSAEARSKAEALKEAKAQINSEARAAAEAQARQAAEAEQRARHEAEARAKAEQAARKSAEQAEKRIREIEKQAAKLVADAQARARAQIQAATREATDRQKALQSELEALRAAQAGKSDEEAQAAGRAAAEAEARHAEAKLEEKARAAADEASKMIEAQLTKLRTKAKQAQDEAAQAQAAREAAQKQADEAHAQATRAAAIASGQPIDRQAETQAAREALAAARKAALEAEAASKAAAKHAQQEQSARKQAEADSMRAAQAEAEAQSYEDAATEQSQTGEDDEHIPEAPVVDESKLTTEQLAAIPQANPVFFQGMVSLVLLLVLLVMTAGCIYLGIELMSAKEQQNNTATQSGVPYEDSQDIQQADVKNKPNPFIVPAGAKVAGTIAVDTPVVYVIDAGGKMGEFFPYAANLVRASLLSLSPSGQFGLFVAQEDQATFIGKQMHNGGKAGDSAIRASLDEMFAAGATDVESAVNEALKQSPKTVVLVLRAKYLNDPKALAKKVATAGSKLIIIMMGVDYYDQGQQLKTAEEACATVRIYETQELVDMYEQRNVPE